VTDYIGKARAISSLYSEIESLNNAIEFLKNNKGNVVITNRMETERIDVKSTQSCQAILAALGNLKDKYIEQLEAILENLSTDGSDT
jgi:hypothetical protein